MLIEIPVDAGVAAVSRHVAGVVVAVIAAVMVNVAVAVLAQSSVIAAGFVVIPLFANKCQ